MRNLLVRVSLPHHRRHAGRTAVLLLTIALGVSSVVATGALIASGLAAASRSWGPAVELADLRVANGFAGVADDLLESVRGVPGVGGAEAVLAAPLRVHSASGQRDLVLIGIDLFEGASVHDAILPREAIVAANPMVFLSRLSSVALPRPVASSLGLKLGSTFRTELRGQRIDFEVGALFDPPPGSPDEVGRVAIADLPAVQRLLQREGLVDAIYVRLADGFDPAKVRAELSAVVAEQATVTSTRGDDRELEALLFNIRLVLDVAGMVAFVVGALVIYHAVALALSQRKPELDVLRSLGVSRNLLLATLTLEALALGAIGSALGIAAGVIQGWATASLFRDALSALYTPLVGSPFLLSPKYILLAVALGLGIPLLATLPSVGLALRLGSSLVVASPQRARWASAQRLAWIGAGSSAFGVVLPLPGWRGASAQSLAAVVTLGDVCVLLGLGLMVPVILLAFVPAADRILKSRAPASFRLSWLALASDPGRTAAIVASIMIATSNVVVSLGTVSSLRNSILGWIGTEEQADLLVTAAGSGMLVPSAPVLPVAVGSAIESIGGVAQVDSIRLVAQPFRDRWVVVQAREPEALSIRLPFEVASGDLAAAARRMRDGDVAVVSQHFATKHEISVGESFRLRTPTGMVELEAGAVVVDYSGDLGTVFVSRESFQRHWRDESVSAYQVWLTSDIDPGAAKAVLSRALTPICDCQVLTFQEYNDRGAEFVDAVFYSAYAIEAVAAVVLIAAIVSFFTISLSERRGELSVLRAVGATRPQVRRLYLGEALMVAVVGGGLGCVAGAWLGKRVVEGAVRTGGGMVMEFALPLQAVAITLAVVMLVGPLSALGPIARATRPASQNEPDPSDA